MCTDVLRRLAVLEADVAALKQQRSTGAADRLLIVLASVVSAAAFNTAEVLGHAHVDGDLDAALVGARVSSARQLGKFLRRHAGVIVGDRELACIGSDRAGRVWCFVLTAEVTSTLPRTP